MNNLNFEVSAITNKGNLRKQNEDNFFINNSFLSAVMADKGMKISKTLYPPFAVGISDGMGGEKSGKEASSVIAKTFYDCLCNSTFCNDKELLIESVKIVNKKICDNVPDSGATLAVIYANNKNLTAVSVGDSRIYLYKSGNLNQITTDHTFAQLQVDAGLITKDQAETSKLRHVLTQYIGIPPCNMLIEPDIFEIKNISIGDTILICSDGFYNSVNVSEIKKILSLCYDTSTTAEMLMDCALKNSGKDNITVMVIKTKKNHFDLKGES